MKERIRGDRRKRNRFEILGTLPGTLETWHRHRVRNLGLGGALVESATPLPAGSRWNARLVMPRGQREVKAEVRYANEDIGAQDARYLIGIAWAEGSRPVDDVVATVGRPAATAPREVERRQYLRTALSDGTEITRVEWSTVTVLDISASGVLFLAPHRMAAGEKGQLRLRLGEGSFVGDIEIRRSERHPTVAGGYRVGAAFTSMPDASRESLEDFIGTAEP